MCFRGQSSGKRETLGKTEHQVECDKCFYREETGWEETEMNKMNPTEWPPLLKEGILEL